MQLVNWQACLVRDNPGPWTLTRPFSCGFVWSRAQSCGVCKVGLVLGRPTCQFAVVAKRLARMSDFIGKDRAEIERKLAGKSRQELIDIIFSISQVEQHFTAGEVAQRSGMTKRTILADVHAGRFNGEYFKRSGNQLTVSASGVAAWRESFRVTVKSAPR